MYAVILDRGRQYKAQKGDQLVLDHLAGEPGASIDLPVLLLADGDKVEVGSPVLSGKKATCKVVTQQRGKKLIAGTFKRRKDSRRRIGHRSEQTVVEVVSIG